MNKKIRESLQVTQEQKKIKTPETQEVVVELAAEMKNKMLSEGKKQVADFEGISEKDLAENEKRAEKEGLVIDSEDKKELEDLGKKAEEAEKDLKLEVKEENEAENKKVMACPNCGKESLMNDKYCRDCGGNLEKAEDEKYKENNVAKITRTGQEKIHALFAAGKKDTPEYQQLSALLMKNENGSNSWKVAEEVDSAGVERALETINQREIYEKGKATINHLHAEGKNTSDEYRELYAQLTDNSDGIVKWRNADGVDSEKINSILKKFESSDESDSSLAIKERQNMAEIETGKEMESGDAAINDLLLKSKIADKAEALKKIMTYSGVNTKGALLKKFAERNDEEFVVADMGCFTPDILRLEPNPKISLLRKVREVGDVLGYDYINSPEYKSRIEDVISKLKSEGEIEEASDVENVFKDLEISLQQEKEKSQFNKIDEKLVALFNDEEKFREYVEIQKNLPPDAIVYLYHGLGKGDYQSALDMLNGKTKGVEQRSGNPTLSLTPSGGHWQGVGFRYALRRDQIAFPGEENPGAVVEMWRRDNGIEDAGVITDKSGGLPLDRFEAEVMRSGHVLPDPDVESELVEKLKYFAKERARRDSL